MTLASKEMLNNRYEIIKPIGSGGMAEVYLAKDIYLDRQVAIKMLRSQFHSDKLLMEQFRREAKSAAQLLHPNIVNVHDVVVAEDEQFIVMEYVDGINLKHYMEQNQLSLLEALDIGIKIAEGLQHAHINNVIHCDIKPLNILIDKNLNPKIADFGIAKMVSSQTMVYTNEIMGSVHYISPEQATGEKVTCLSDIYSLGIMLYEMLTGKVPFTGETPLAVAMMHAEKDAPPLAEYMTKVPDGLQEIMDKALARRPEDRYQSAFELRRELVNLRMSIDPSEDYSLGANYQGANGSADTTMNITRGTAFRKPMSDNEVSTVVMQPVRSKANGQDFADTLILPNGSAVPAVEKSPKLEDQLKEVLDSLGKKKKEEAEEMAVRRKINYTRVLLLVTAVVVVISVIAHFVLGGKKEVVAVPDVVNKTTAEAKQQLYMFNIQIDEKFGDEAKFKPGVVMEQSVKAGEKRKEGSLIILTVSKGAEQKGVPDLKGMSLVKATTTLENLGFKVGKIEKKYVKQEKLGAVLSQIPKAAEQLGKGSSVDLVINEGDIAIPQIVGKHKDEAARMLASAKLTLGSVTVISDENYKKDTVVMCNPDVSVKVGEGDKVDISVSDGGMTNSVYVDFAIPGNKMSNVIITVEDNSGKRTLFSGMKKGGIRIRQKVETKGKAKATLVVDGLVIEEKSL